MEQLPKSMLSRTALWLHIIVIPVFFLSFIMLYRSVWMTMFIGMEELTDIDNTLTFNTLMLMCIQIGVLCASRIPLTVARRHWHIQWTHYILWCIGEWILIGLFMALYMTLIYRGTMNYFVVVRHCMALIGTVLIYPYVIINLLMYCAKENYVVPSEDDVIRFVDSTKRLKLIIAVQNILYVQADENYVLIKYVDGERIKEYSLRASMKSIEEVLTKHNIVRCQRSYFINPTHVKVVRRDKEGFINAELDVVNIKPIPVSVKYYDVLNSKL